MSHPSSPPFGVGRVISQTFGLLFAKFSTVFPMAFVPAVALSLVNLVAERLSPAPAEGELVAAPGFAGVLLGTLGMVLSYFVVGFLCLVALDAVIGRSHSVGQYARQAARQLLPIAVLGLAISLLAGLGFLLLIVPGLYVIARFLPWVEAVVFEDAGWRGLGRAQELTEGYRWPLVGAILLMGVATLVLVVLAGGALYAVETNAVLSLLVESLISAFYYALVSIFTALVYARLREIKEGATVEEIAASIG
ncbi:hypothetical protein [Amaricoccus solimangrovi]|uniref:Glycerophosphoryl diester phosphodiesterase membrane domain-containing protein n=1 Tax=Amaricoccus solimangrovi TaxID=2589815 RepID=A0A501WQ71_9RHOB|nr:hypothetical protein [Amaricoccus solimangrovi]TPE50500.1 hypothetical protein FJM51_11955 [Amaricoccus solimangrovi]